LITYYMALANYNSFKRSLHNNHSTQGKLLNPALR
jgi:hypothetical protein